MLLSGIRTFLERKLWRLERLLIGNYMDNLRTNGVLFPQSQQPQGIVWRGRRDLNPRPPA